MEAAGFFRFWVGDTCLSILNLRSCSISLSLAVARSVLLSTHDVKKPADEPNDLYITRDERRKTTEETGWYDLQVWKIAVVFRRFILTGVEYCCWIYSFTYNKHHNRFSAT